MIFVSIILVSLILIASHIRNIYTQLNEIENTLNRIEVLQYTDDGISTNEHMEIDYVASIAAINVEKPIQRTKSEVIQRLSILGQSNPIIEDIYNNSLQYPDNLLSALANNPEMADFVSRYTDEERNVACNLTNLEKEQSFPLFLQWDPRWGYQSYGTESNIGLAGCGPTCISMMLFYLTRDEKLTPDRIAAYSMENDYYVEGTGTAWALMEDMPKLYDIKVTNPKVSKRAMENVLNDGGIIICAMSEGDFTVSGHFIIIYGYDMTGFMINDPNCVARSNKRWTFEDLEHQIKNIWAYVRSVK